MIIGLSEMRYETFSFDLKQADLSSILQDHGIQMTDIGRNKKNYCNIMKRQGFRSQEFGKSSCLRKKC